MHIKASVHDTTLRTLVAATVLANQLNSVLNGWGLLIGSYIYQRLLRQAHITQDLYDPASISYSERNITLV